MKICVLSNSNCTSPLSVLPFRIEHKIYLDTYVLFLLSSLNMLCLVSLPFVVAYFLNITGSFGQVFLSGCISGETALQGAQGHIVTTVLAGSLVP